MIKPTKEKTTRAERNIKEEKQMMNMMNKIKTNPTLAAAFYFVLTWMGFPLAAFVNSQLRGISFAEAACRPYILATFILGSTVAAVSMYFKTKDSLM